jgi:hypothetical protein
MNCAINPLLITDLRHALPPCDLDHIVPFNQGGPTTPQNLHPACRRHHQLKTHAGWATTRDTDATITWTAPTGHHYTVTDTPRGPSVPLTTPGVTRR